MCKIEILFSDEYLLVVNKPAGLRTIADGYNPTLPHLRSILEDKENRMWIVHRLDKDTSGAIILARTPAVHRALNMQFEAREVEKIYHAIIVGVPRWRVKTISYPLLKNGDRKHRTIIDHKKGKPAVTEVQLIKTFREHSLLQVIPRSGYTHQIRSHLAAAEFPILSDPLYSRKGAPKQDTHLHSQGPEIINRTALHAISLEFSHPHHNSRLSIQAPYPQDFTEALKYLELKGSGGEPPLSIHSQ